MGIATWHLACRSARTFLNWEGTSNLGFVSSILTATLTIAITTYFSWKRKTAQGRGVGDLWSDAWIALKAFLVIAAMLYGPVMLYSVPWVIYNDHESLLAQNKALGESLGPKDQRIRQLTSKLNQTCYLPDRNLTQEARDVLHESLKQIAEKYQHPNLQLGYFSGDTESLRVWIVLHSIFKNAGFHVPDMPMLRAARTKVDDPPSFGYTEGLSIQEKMGTKTLETSQRNALAQEIAQAFNDAGVQMQGYPIGPSQPVKDAKELIVWIGIKKVDWSQIH